MKSVGKKKTKCQTTSATSAILCFRTRRNRAHYADAVTQKHLLIAADVDRRFVDRISADPRFATTGARTTNRKDLRPLLEERLATRTRAEWFDVLIAAGVPCGPINTIDGGVAFAEKIGLRPVVTAGEGAAGVPTIRHPIDFSVTPPSYPLPPPALDEHGEQVRSWLAGPPGPPPWDAAGPETVYSDIDDSGTGAN